MHDFLSPDGRTWEWADVMWFIQTGRMSRRWPGFYPLLVATGLCIENPELLQEEKKLFIATRDTMKQDDWLQNKPSTPGVVKKSIAAAINRAWRRWLWRETGDCPDCPIPITVFIARIIEALDTDASLYEQHDMVWREYKGEQHGSDQSNNWQNN